jgi:hypothetical protein
VFTRAHTPAGALHVASDVAGDRSILRDPFTVEAIAAEPLIAIDFDEISERRRADLDAQFPRVKVELIELGLGAIRVGQVESTPRLEWYEALVWQTLAERRKRSSDSCRRFGGPIQQAVSIAFGREPTCAARSNNEACGQGSAEQGDHSGDRRLLTCDFPCRS